MSFDVSVTVLGTINEFWCVCHSSRYD